MKVALIGYGAIGRSIASRLVHSPPAGIRLVGVLMRPSQLAALGGALPAAVSATDGLDGLLSTEPDVVVEAAGHAAVVEYGADILDAGHELFVLSTGVFANDVIAERLRRSAVSGGGRIVVPCGALAGFDGLLALRESGLISVTYRSVKPVDAWRGTAAEQEVDLDNLREPRTFFTGSARNAALRFPKNANLSVAVALAGVGLDKTLVELVADPAARENSGQVIAQAECARLDLKLTGAGFGANPKTSAITGLSVVSSLVNRSAVISYQ